MGGLGSPSASSFFYCFYSFVVILYNTSKNQIIKILMKKVLRETKTLRAAVVRRSQKFRPAADPFPGARDGLNLISWRWSLPLPTDPVW